MARKDWKQVFPADYDNIQNSDKAFKVTCNLSEDYVLLLEDDFFLACVYRKDKERVAILYTFNAQMMKPTCSLCSSPWCKCLR